MQSEKQNDELGGLTPLHGHYTKMNDRLEKIKVFDNFSSRAKAIFRYHQRKNSKHSRLIGMYGFYICPGGRNGGIDKKLVDIFYGNRPIDSVTTINENFQQGKRLETAQGAALAYIRKDDGHVVCNLYPAYSENQRQAEQFIILDFIKDPEKLMKRSKCHWRMLLAYMETTCIDGNPNVLDKILVFYLKNFKRMLVGTVLKQRAVTVALKQTLKYVSTVGLSGFLILVFSYFKDSITTKQEKLKLQAVTHSISSHFNGLSNEVYQLRSACELIDSAFEKHNNSISEIHESLIIVEQESSNTVANVQKILSAVQADSLSRLMDINILDLNLTAAISSGTNTPTTLKIQANNKEIVNPAMDIH